MATKQPFFSFLSGENKPGFSLLYVFPLVPWYPTAHTDLLFAKCAFVDDPLLWTISSVSSWASSRPACFPHCDRGATPMRYAYISLPGELCMDICYKTCRSVSGGQPEYQLCFASRRRNGCALLRDPAACFCSAGLSLRPAFTTFNFRHLPGASLRCPKLLLQDYGHETVSGAVNTACCHTDDAALCCIQKSPGMSPATSLSVQFACPRKALKHLSLVPYKLEVRSSLTNTRVEISCLSQSHRLPALLWAGWPRKAAVLISPFLKVSHPEQEAGPPTPWAGSWR